jgi:hypothetical protein
VQEVVGFNNSKRHGVALPLRVQTVMESHEMLKQSWKTWGHSIQFSVIKTDTSQTILG